MSTPNKSVVKYLSEIGTRGGSVKSERKALAVRANGLKGGRPKKLSTVTPAPADTCDKSENST